MKKLKLSLCLSFLTAFGFAQSYNHVNGYYRSNGTYVQGYYRTNPDYTRNNNWSAIGNVNPFTGETGTKRIDYFSSPSYNTQSYNYGRLNNKQIYY